MTLKELHLIAQETLDSRESPELTLQAIESYIQKFEDWSKSILSETLPKKDLEDLLELHKKIVLKAEELKKDTAKERGQLKKKAKGLISYLDTLPSRISSTRGRKG